MKEYKTLTLDWWANRIEYKDKKSLVKKFNLLRRLGILHKFHIVKYQKAYFIPCSNYSVDDIVLMIKTGKIK